ncbi:CAP domain-containing protein [Sorangium sp. So ce1000]|uniref:CAP domain-containing protein n=1 Tax=Sorangium sp. So ce1000 TaxID=3133325 RepID=UPI003F61FD44
MLTTWTPSGAVALAATFIASVLSGCVGEMGDASLDGEGSGPSSGTGVEIPNGGSGSGPSTGNGGSTAAGTGGSAAAATGGAGGSATTGAGGSATTGAGGSGSGAGGAGGAGGSATTGAGGSATTGAGGSATTGAGGSGGGSGSGAGGAGGAGGSATTGAGGSGGAGPGSGAGGAGGGASTAQLCVDTINQHRATLGLPPLARWVEAESCSDKEAESDGNTGEAHGAFGSCDENAQNECPGWGGPPDEMIVPCLQLMWDEGPGEDFSTHGHYINMSNPRYTKVACGFHTFSDGSVWAVQNFR